jgi:hypothetical protein
MAQQGGTPANGGYPYQIRASDLDKNFVFATLDADPSLVETSTGQGGHPQRRLKIPAAPGSGTKNLTASSGALAWTDAIPTPPSSGTHVLGAVDGALTWIATEEC